MTYHNKADNNSISKTVLICGDPLRAKYINDKFLDNGKEITNIRNMLGYTGYYKKNKITVLGTGMGCPSTGIYVYELFKDYNVDNVIRLGTCGGYKKEILPGDLVIALTASTDSNWAHQYNLNGTYSPCVSPYLLNIVKNKVNKLNYNYFEGMILSSDLFSEYNALGKDSWKKWKNMGAIAQDMETYALYSISAYFNKNSLSILTMTDNLETNKYVDDRVNCLNNMITLALEASCEF